MRTWAEPFWGVTVQVVTRLELVSDSVKTSTRLRFCHAHPVGPCPSSCSQLEMGDGACADPAHLDTEVGESRGRKR